MSERRTEAAARLDMAVAGELAPLKLDAAKFRTRVEPLPESQWGAGGADRVEFLIATNPGAPFAPLTKIASGGGASALHPRAESRAGGARQRADDDL